MLFNAVIRCIIITRSSISIIIINKTVIADVANNNNNYCYDYRDISISLFRVAEEVSRSDLEDRDIHDISEKLAVNQFYDLGVALGFPIKQLDSIEYKWSRDRQQASYDMLVTWRQAQASHQEAKEKLLSLMKSLDSPAGEMEMTGLPMKILVFFYPSFGLYFCIPINVNMVSIGLIRLKYDKNRENTRV